jgi:23S rRNA pseudouridine1911/1915/1917 synthase
MDDGPIEIIVLPEEADLRLDRILAARLQDVSRARIQGWIGDGHIRLMRGGVAHPKLTPSLNVQTDDHILVTPPLVRPTPLAGEAIPLDIVYEDDDLLVVNKPAGLVVHPAPGNPSGTLVNALIAHCGDSLAGIGGERRPGIVHRLDKETSGLLVIAKHDAAHQFLSEQFKSHGRDGRLIRKYHALVWGRPLPTTGTINAAIGRSSHNRVKMAISKGHDAREAITHYRCLSHHGELLSQVECRLETGRTHQIRVHMTHLGHPVIGDTVYGAGMRSRIERLPEALGEAIQALGRQALHAATLGFEHPRSGEAMLFTAEPPADMAHLCDLMDSL